MQSMLNFSKAFLVSICLLLTGACDGAASDPVGKWERRHQEPGGEDFLDVLVLDEQGRYVRHATGFLNDRGQYRFADGRISFTSTENQRNSREATVTFAGGDTMVLGVQPFGFEESWQRSSRSPNYSTVDMDGRLVPANVPEILKAVYQTAVRTWQADAVPTGIDIEELASGYYEVVLGFFSSSTARHLQVEITPYNHLVLDLDGSRAPQAPLPLDFLDLPAVVGIARDAGFPGALVRASLADYDRFGAVWTGHTGGPRGFQVTAGTGSLVNDDITGYRAQYEADWNAAGAMWREVMEQFRPRERERYYPYISYLSKDSCEQAGHNWNGSAPGSCDN